MTFSEMVQLLHKYISAEMQKWEFVQHLCFLIMHEPSSEADKKLNDQDKYYLYSTIRSKSAAGKVYRGDPKHSLPPKKAGYLLSHYNKTALIDTIYEIDDDPKEKLCEDLNAHGITCTFDNVPDAVADALYKILEARKDGSEGYDFGTAVIATQDKRPSVSLELSSLMMQGVVYVKEGVVYYPGGTIKLPPELNVENEDMESESPYIKALCEAYASALKRDSVTAQDVPTLPKQYGVHFSAQRRAFYAAEYVRESVRDVFIDGDYQFAELEDEAYDGISETYWADYSNGYERLNAVINKATSTQLNKSSLYHVNHLVGVKEMKGLCHIMVNDRRIKSWVNLDA